MILKEYKESYFSLLWHKLLRLLLGPLVLASDQDDPQQPKELIVKFYIKGKALSVYCQASTYVLGFNRWFLKNKYFILYRFTSVAEEDMDPRIIKAIQKDIYFPDIAFDLYNQKHKMRVLVNAYMDVLIARMKNLKDLEEKQITN